MSILDTFKEATSDKAKSWFTSNKTEKTLAVVIKYKNDLVLPLKALLLKVDIPFVPPAGDKLAGLGFLWFVDNVLAGMMLDTIIEALQLKLDIEKDKATVTYK